MFNLVLMFKYKFFSKNCNTQCLSDDLENFSKHLLRRLHGFKLESTCCFLLMFITIELNSASHMCRVLIK